MLYDYLIELTTTLRDGFYYHPHFAEEKPEAQRVRGLPQLTQ